MKRTIITTAIVLCLALWGMAQQGYPSGQQSQSSQSQASEQSSGKQATIEGCLSSSDGGYVLTDQSGTKYQLSGDTSKLSAHVNHEIQITGTKSKSAASSSSTSSGSMAQSSTSQPTLEVSSMKHISETCKSSSGGMTPR